MPLGRRHRGGDRLGIRDVALETEPSEFRRRGLGQVAVEVRDDDSGRAPAHQLAAHRAADAATGARDECRLALDLHAGAPQAFR